jgi:hypothetical protein
VQGLQGIQGIQGIAGTVGSIVGTYNSLAELQAEVPVGTPGAYYYINPDLYVWDMANSQWVNMGTIAGPQGVQGIQGPTGIQGIDGPTGPQGNDGPTGPQGVAGPTGPQGIAGPTGPQGIAGPTGPQGIAGPTGTQGIAGPTGPIGATLVPDYANGTMVAQGGGGVNTSFFPTGSMPVTNSIAGSTITATNNGIYYLQVAPTSTSAGPVIFNLYVNGKMLMQETSTGANSFVSFTLPVKAGDTVRLIAYNPNTSTSNNIPSYTTSSQLTFVPLVKLP